MTVTLSKNESISLEKTAAATLSHINMGIGWNPVKRWGILGILLGHDDIDINASCLVLDSTGDLLDAIWIWRRTSRDGCIEHRGGNLRRAATGDDETISVELSRLPAGAQYLVFTISSFSGQTFTHIENAYCRLVNPSNDTELAHFNLSEKGHHTGVIMAYMKRNTAGWELTALGAAGSGKRFEDIVRDAQRVCQQVSSGAA
ncbi:TerD family protein [Marinobacterium rhizophilum]|uniref:TerD family protein n=1 Tax=Marinobacterium rhizophilum TaxID=420402 RepID=UPI000379E43A|nr:TerD family protein [Marinobacterium rhizophilum]